MAGALRLTLCRTGRVGSDTTRLAALRGGVEIVAAVSRHDAHHGRDLGELARVGATTRSPCPRACGRRRPTLRLLPYTLRPRPLFPFESAGELQMSADCAANTSQIGSCPT